MVENAHAKDHVDALVRKTSIVSGPDLQLRFQFCLFEAFAGQRNEFRRDVDGGNGGAAFAQKKCLLARSAP